ncbi:MAG: nuclear transport factor 2 family protein [Saprospiraceae bacterium]|nr:nuclear transport factor 2 family protein [Saprospiraceae bacterium]
MKNVYLFTCLIIALYLGLGGCTPKIDIAMEKINVKKVVDQFAQFWETEDMALLSKIMAHDSNMINFGSDASEIFTGWENFRKSAESMMPAFENTKIKVRDQNIRVHASGQVAWFTEIWDWDLMYGGEHAVMSNQRLSGVLERINGKWVLVQFHNSVPAGA